MKVRLTSSRGTSSPSVPWLTKKGSLGMQELRTCGAEVARLSLATSWARRLRPQRLPPPAHALSAMVAPWLLCCMESLAILPTFSHWHSTIFCCGRMP